MISVRIRFIFRWCIILMLAFSFVEAQSTNISDFRTLIEQVKRTMSERAREDSGVYMDTPEWLDRPECAELQKALQTN